VLRSVLVVRHWRLRPWLCGAGSRGYCVALLLFYIILDPVIHGKHTVYRVNSGIPSLAGVRRALHPGHCLDVAQCFKKPTVNDGV
jgi:hypothetical protein